MTTTETNTFAAITANTTVVIVTGCKPRDVRKGAKATVKEVKPLGADYSHMVKVVLFFPSTGKTLAFYARHVNRLSDEFVAMNDGNPNHRIEIRRG